MRADARYSQGLTLHGPSVPPGASLAETPHMNLTLLRLRSRLRRSVGVPLGFARSPWAAAPRPRSRPRHGPPPPRPPPYTPLRPGNASRHRRASVGPAPGSRPSGSGSPPCRRRGGRSSPPPRQDGASSVRKLVRPRHLRSGARGTARALTPRGPPRPVARHARRPRPFVELALLHSSPYLARLGTGGGGSRHGPEAKSRSPWHNRIPVGPVPPRSQLQPLVTKSLTRQTPPHIVGLELLATSLGPCGEGALSLLSARVHVARSWGRPWRLDPPRGRADRPITLAGVMFAPPVRGGSAPLTMISRVSRTGNVGQASCWLAAFAAIQWEQQAGSD